MPLPLLKAYKLSGKIEFDSNHQSSLFLIIYSNNLHMAEDKAMGLKDAIEFALGIGITLKSVQDSGIIFDIIILFKIERRRSSALIGKLRNIIADMWSMPEARDLREAIAEFNSFKDIGFLRQCSEGEEAEYA